MIYIKGQVWEYRQNCEYCGISNKWTIPKFANFWNQICVLQIGTKFYKINFPIYEIIKFPLSADFQNLQNNNQISEILKFRKVANFENLTICKTIQIPKISNLVSYHICILSVRTI